MDKLGRHQLRFGEVRGVRRCLEARRGVSTGYGCAESFSVPPSDQQGPRAPNSLSKYSKDESKTNKCALLVVLVRTVLAAFLHRPRGVRGALALSADNRIPVPLGGPLCAEIAGL